MTKKELLKKCEDLGIENANESLTNKELTSMIEAKEAELKDVNANPEPAKPKAGKKPAKPKAGKKPIYTDNRGIKWQFKDSAPKTINIDGRPMTQAEIIETEEVVSELVFGNSNFLTQKQ